MRKIFKILSEWINKIRKIIWLAAFVLLFFVFVSFSEKSNNSVICKQVVINIQKDEMKGFINEENIYNLAVLFNNGPVEGMMLQDIDLFGLEKALQQNSFVEDVEVYSGINGILYIDLFGRTPSFRVIPKNNSGFYVDINGKVMPLSGQYTAHVPVMTGYVSKSDFEAGKLSEYFILMALLEEDPLLKSLIGQVAIDRKGRIKLIPKTGVSIIDFGECNYLQSKLRKIKVFYKKILPSENWKAHEKLIVKYKGQIILK